MHSVLYSITVLCSSLNACRNIACMHIIIKPVSYMHARAQTVYLYSRV